MVQNYTFYKGKWVLNRDLTILKTKDFRNVFGKLPNNLVMDIIRIADGGKITHKVKYSQVLTQLDKSLNKDAMFHCEDEARWSEAWDFKNQVCPEGCYGGPGGIEYDYEDDPCLASRVWFERLFR